MVLDQASMIKNLKYLTQQKLVQILASQRESIMLTNLQQILVWAPASTIQPQPHLLIN